MISVTGIFALIAFALALAGIYKGERSLGIIAVLLLCIIELLRSVAAIR